MNKQRYNKNDLEVVKKTECEILQIIDTICRNHNLKYFVIGGTAIGAVRHKGFIPWDDDIDIGMLRRDYDQFLEFAKHDLPEGYFLQNYLNDSNCPTYHTKLRKDGTEFIEESTKNLDIHQGIFVDICPFDNLPDDKRTRRRFINHTRSLYQFFIAKSVWTSTLEKKPLKKLIKTIARLIIKLLALPVSKKRCFEKLDSYLRKYDGETTHWIAMVYSPINTAARDDVYPISDYEFEGMMVMGPGNIDAFLTKRFGTYMKLPPEKERVAHAPIKISY